MTLKKYPISIKQKKQNAKCMYDNTPCLFKKNNIHQCCIENKNKTHIKTHPEIYTPSF